MLLIAKERKGRIKSVIITQKANILNKYEYKLIIILTSKLPYNTASRMKYISANI